MVVEFSGNINPSHVADYLSKTSEAHQTIVAKSPHLLELMTAANAASIKISKLEHAFPKIPDTKSLTQFQTFSALQNLTSKVGELGPKPSTKHVPIEVQNIYNNVVPEYHVQVNNIVNNPVESIQFVLQMIHLLDPQFKARAEKSALNLHGKISTKQGLEILQKMLFFFRLEQANIGGNFTNEAYSWLSNIQWEAESLAEEAVSNGAVGLGHSVASGAKLENLIMQRLIKQYFPNQPFMQEFLSLIVNAATQIVSISSQMMYGKTNTFEIMQAMQIAIDDVEFTQEGWKYSNTNAFQQGIEKQIQEQLGESGWDNQGQQSGKFGNNITNQSDSGVIVGPNVELPHNKIQEIENALKAPDDLLMLFGMVKLFKEMNQDGDMSFNHYMAFLAGVLLNPSAIRDIMFQACSVPYYELWQIQNQVQVAIDQKINLEEQAFKNINI